MATQPQEEAAARKAAQDRQLTQSRPGPGEGQGSPLPGEVPTSGPLVEAGTYVGQQPYTDPPPMALRRFYEDPRPPEAASEQQVLQGRGAPPPYPPLEPPPRAWNPRRYEDQMDVPRPADSKQPSEYEANASMTLAQFLALPREQQDRILEQARAQASIGQVPEYRPTRQYVEEEDKREQEAQRVREEAEQRRLAQGGTGTNQGAAGVPRMRAPTEGTMTAGDRIHPDHEPPKPEPKPEPQKR